MVSHGAARTEIGLPVDERHLTRYADTCIELIAHVYTPKALSQTDVMAHSETSKRIDTPPTLHVLLHATLQHIKQQCFFFAFPIAKKNSETKIHESLIVTSAMSCQSNKRQMMRRLTNKDANKT